MVGSRWSIWWSLGDMLVMDGVGDELLVHAGCHFFSLSLLGR